MKKFLTLFSCALVAFLFSMVLYAQVVVLPETLPVDGQATDTILFLLQNWKALGPVGIGMVIVSLIVQLTKTDFLGNWFKKLEEWKQIAFITLVGLIYSGVYIVFYTKQGVEAWIAVGLIASGGAVSLFNLVKLVYENIKKKKVSA